MNSFLSTTRGKGSHKTLLVVKKENCELVENELVLSVSGEALGRLDTSQELFNIGLKEREDLMARIQKPRSNMAEERIRRVCRFRSISPQAVAPALRTSAVDKSPANFYRAELAGAINLNRVMCIAGEVGSGKTTLVCIKKNEMKIVTGR